MAELFWSNATVKSSMRAILKSGVVKAGFQPTPNYTKQIGELPRQTLSAEMYFYRLSMNPFLTSQ